MSELPPESSAADRRIEERQPLRPYRRPELEGYGSLKELTQTLGPLTPGDPFGGSFPT